MSQDTVQVPREATEAFCEDEGCPQFGTKHICVSALIQARGALKLDAMVDDQGNLFGTTAVALEAIDAALAALTTQPSKTETRDDG